VDKKFPGNREDGKKSSAAALPTDLPRDSLQPGFEILKSGLGKSKVYSIQRWRRHNRLPGRIRKKSLSQLDLSTITQIALSPDEERHFACGIALFNSRKFWEAHEAWEEIWQHHPEDGRFFIQGLIQLAAAYHQLLRKIYRGFVIHIKRARERLVLFPNTFLGINVAALLETLNGSVKVIDGNENLTEADFSGMEIPRIDVVN
jgi:hypothetical protein